MTQRIFDKDNKKDMQDLWDIVPDKVYIIRRGICDSDIRLWYDTKGGKTSADCYLCDFLKINWRGAEEITRPVDYESAIGCVGWFWDDSKADDTSPCLGVLTAIARGEYYTQVGTWGYDNFRPAKKSELKFWGE